MSSSSSAAAARTFRFRRQFARDSYLAAVGCARKRPPVFGNKVHASVHRHYWPLFTPVQCGQSIEGRHGSPAERSVVRGSVGSSNERCGRDARTSGGWRRRGIPSCGWSRSRSSSPERAAECACPGCGCAFGAVAAAVVLGGGGGN